MASINFEGKVCESKEKESVLDCLLRHGLDIPHGCKGGACQSCMMHASQGTPTPSAQAGLKDALKTQGYFLSCSCVPTDNMTVTLEQAIPRSQSVVLSADKISASVLRVRLAKTIDYVPGQYVNIWHKPQSIRSYSIASHPTEDDFIELHIKHIPDGAFSHWAWERLQVDMHLDIQGPMGSCFYTATAKDQPLILAGIGTGLAPLIGIARDALAQQHQGPIALILGAKSVDGFYLQSELASLAAQHKNFTVSFVAQEDADIYAYIKEHYPSTKDHRIFLCGAESFVRKMKKQCFLAGANMKDISADPFLPCNA